MRIMYFGKNKEEGTERVAVIRFTDDEFDLYKYIENYEHNYGDEKRKFACGGLIGIERNEKGVWVNESYISVNDFTDFNDFKANYKEAKKEFNAMKKNSSDTEPESATDPETSETVPTTKIFDSEEECDNTEKNLNLNNFLKALIKAVGIEKVKEIRYTVQCMNVFFEYQGEMYKCYTPQSKLYKLVGQRFYLITWRDLKKEATETDDNNGDKYTARPPPETSLLNLSRK